MGLRPLFHKKTKKNRKKLLHIDSYQPSKSGPWLEFSRILSRAAILIRIKEREGEGEKEGYFFALVAASNEERFSGGHDIGSFEEDVAR